MHIELMSTILFQAWQFSCASRVLTPFNVAVALSIVGMNILSEQVCNISEY